MKEALQQKAQPPARNTEAAAPWRPVRIEELQESVGQALAEKTTLAPGGAGGKAGWGRAGSGVQPLDLRAFNTVVDYQPQELLLVAQPGLLLEEAEALLAERGQMLAFEPPHWSSGATLGGTLACNLSGPRRPFGGAARDHLLGFQAVSGRAEVLRGGGRVVKNVTGYDLSKLLCGAFGTLALMTEICIKVRPRPQATCTFLSLGGQRSAALALLRQAALRPENFSALACLEPGCPPPPGLERELPTDQRRALLRLEGAAPMVRSLRSSLDAIGGCRLSSLDQEPSWRLWQAIREASFIRPAAGEQLWRISLPPLQAEPLALGLEDLGPTQLAFDWGGGLIWARMPAALGGAQLHPLALQHGGWALRVQEGAPPAGGAAQPPEAQPCTPLQGIPLRLNQNLKQAFDPHGILNPQRLHAEF